jgi:hypothetical protein
MSQRLDALVVREYTDAQGETRASFTKIGTAFAAKNGPGYTLVLDALPMPTMYRDGKLSCRVLLKEPQPRDGQQQGGQRQQQRPAQQQRRQGGYDAGPSGGAGDFDDSIPF